MKISWLSIGRLVSFVGIRWLNRRCTKRFSLLFAQNLRSDPFQVGVGVLGGDGCETSVEHEPVSKRISLLRGGDYQIGHGVLIPEAGRDVTDPQSATSLVQERWLQIEQHVGELFFGDPRGEVAVLGGYAEDIYRLKEGYLRTELTTEVIRPTPETPEAWTATLRAIARTDAE